jgi:hypothetical protein
MSRNTSSALHWKICSGRRLRLFTWTGEAVAGDPQHSYRNILEADFRKLLARESFAPGSA